jgi:hypothetical protein
MGKQHGQELDGAAQIFVNGDGIGFLRRHRQLSKRQEGQRLNFQSNDFARLPVPGRECVLSEMPEAGAI